jgi:hypothetical protein
MAVVAHRPGGVAAGPVANGMSLRVDFDKRTGVTSFGLYLPERLPFEVWHRMGTQIALISNVSAWWLGDWLVYGADQYPDRYKAAIAGTSLDYKTLRNYAWVARRFEMSRRRDKLSFQHHAEVAALTLSEQELWLDRAQAFRWSKAELRHHLHRRVRREPGRGETTVLVLRLEVTRPREERWHAAADRADSTFEEWLALVLDSAADRLLDEQGSKELN